MLLRYKLILSIVIAIFFFSPTFSQDVRNIILAEPENNQITSAKPMFKIIIEGENLPRNLKYKIEISNDNFDTVMFTFEQLNNKKGWSIHELYNEEDYNDILERGAFYRAYEDLPDGLYQWRASVHTGVTYQDGSTVSSFIVDSTPPAEVIGLRLAFDATSGFTKLQWDPVFLDVNGRSEYIDHYNVYRYERRSFFFVIRPFFIGSTETESFVDRDVNKSGQGKVLFYKVVAVDKAGNELGRRY